VDALARPTATIKAETTERIMAVPCRSVTGGDTMTDGACEAATPIRWMKCLIYDNLNRYAANADASPRRDERAHTIA
jgi:hypothetical protein